MNVLKLLTTAVPPSAVALAKKLGAVASLPASRRQGFKYTRYYTKDEMLMPHHDQKTEKKAQNFINSPG